MKKKQTERRKLFRKLNKTFWSWYFRNLYLIFKIPILLKNSQNIGQDMKKYGWCLVIYFIRMPFKTITWGIGQMRKKSIMRNYLGSVLSFCHWIKLFHLVYIFLLLFSVEFPVLNKSGERGQSYFFVVIRGKAFQLSSLC